MNVKGIRREHMRNRAQMSIEIKRSLMPWRPVPLLLLLLAAAGAFGAFGVFTGTTHTALAGKLTDLSASASFHAQNLGQGYTGSSGPNSASKSGNRPLDAATLSFEPS